MQREGESMLLRFEVSNHRSISDPIELSMIAVDEDRPATRGFDRLDERVLTVAGIYGPNASGKSNVLDALAWLSGAVGRSLRAWGDFVPRSPFKFAGGPRTPSSYEMEVVVEGVRFGYRLEVDDTEVLFEGLYGYPERRRRVLFERDGMNISFRRGFEGITAVRELLTPSTLALSAVAGYGAPEVRSVHRSLSRVEVLGRPRWAGWRGLPRLSEIDQRSTIQLFGAPRPARPDPPPDEPESAGDRRTALALLRFADEGIDDVRFIHSAVTVTGAATPGEARFELQLLHRAGDEEQLFPFDEESAGTRTWFMAIGPVLAALRTGQVLLFDEIDASLHPRLSARILELFQDPETNPRGAQLIFTSHDTSLLNHLNRDEVWLTEKGEDGATTLTALAEYGGDKVRRSLNLEKAYLQGRFGAVPDLDQFVVRQALGLASSD